MSWVLVPVLEDALDGEKVFVNLCDQVLNIAIFWDQGPAADTMEGKEEEVSISDIYLQSSPVPSSLTGITFVMGTTNVEEHLERACLALEVSHLAAMLYKAHFPWWPPSAWPEDCTRCGGRITKGELKPMPSKGKFVKW
ncbi:hypothetical protein PAXINDRAFT_157255 [Paxillus involutus ATCC 200175]|uniref:Uncharacterized protein n=1 Tax=Paxillus involutus ATCC 200175 TaxID=664439 RepID=A0A0C9TV35_PAXIN|nr:hypothetical protein PAXINDRAFT_157255 [Paxillus involutus ATCC 200175]